MGRGFLPRCWFFLSFSSLMSSLFLIYLYYDTGHSSKLTSIQVSSTLPYR
jgi:hypothetical protein